MARYRRRFVPTQVIRPPTVIGAAPTQAQQTIRVTCVAARTRAVNQRQRAVVYKLYPPTVVAPAAPTFVAAPIEVTLTAVGQRIARKLRRPFYDLYAPTVLAQPPPTARTTTTLVAVQAARAARRLLSQPFLPGPAVVTTPDSARPIRVTLASDVRLHRRVSSRLTPPQAVAAAAQVFPGARVTLVRTRPRPTRVFVGEPTTLQTFQGARVTLARIRPRPTKSFIGEPAVVAAVQVYAAARVTLVRTRPRPTTAAIFPPATLQSATTFPGTRVTLARIRPRPVRSVLSEPAVVGPVAVYPAARVVLAPRNRPRPVRAQIFEPAVVAAAAQLVQPITVVLAPSRRPGRLSTFLRPQGITAPVVTALRVTLAGRTRVEAQRRAPHSELGTPKVVNAPPTQQQQTVRSTLAGRTRIELQRRAAHYELLPPAKVAPPPGQREQTIRVTLAAISDRLNRLRRGTHSKFIRAVVVVPITPPVRDQLVIRTKTVRLNLLARRVRSELYPPTVVGPFVPDGDFGHGASGFPPAQVMALLNQISRRGVESLEDDEVALLMLLGYL